MAAAAAASLTAGLAVASVAVSGPAASAAAAHAVRAAHAASTAHAISRAAAAAASACPKGDVCAWSGTHYTGSHHGISGTKANDKGSFDWSHAESVFNNGRRCNAIVWTRTNFSGTPRAFARGHGLASLRGTDAWHHLYSNSWAQCT
ncbi:MAG TPA: peptidase inhibitor family I36 protein [Streptosporangiaceae bacterium]|jgi:hypothetical protein